MDWKKISERLNKELEDNPAFPTHERDRLMVKVWYWKGIANLAGILAEEKGD
jgi:hypothetical protein